MNRSGALAAILSLSAASILGLVLSIWSTRQEDVRNLRATRVTRGSDGSDVMQLGPLEKFRATPKQWQDWLTSELISKGVTRFEPDISESGCGISMKVNSMIASHNGFFQVQ